MRRPFTPTVPVLLAVAASAGLASCGSSSDSSASASAAAASTPVPTVAASSPATTTADVSASTPATSTTPAEVPGVSTSPSAGTTAPGTTLAIGQPAILDFHDDTAKKQGIVTVTVKSISKASIGDFKNMDLDAKDKTSTPYYLKVSVKNTGTTDLSGTNPQHFLSGIDDRGQEQNALIVLGTFDSCNSDNTPKTFKPGVSFDSCLPYLVAGGGSIKGAQWNVYDPKTNKLNVIWK